MVTKYIAEHTVNDLMREDGLTLEKAKELFESVEKLTQAVSLLNLDDFDEIRLEKI